MKRHGGEMNQLVLARQRREQPPLLFLSEWFDRAFNILQREGHAASSFDQKA